MKWPILLVLTVAQVLVISGSRRGQGHGHGHRPTYHSRDEDYDDRQTPESVDYDDYDQSPERTSYHRHDGYDREENQVVNAFASDEEDYEDGADDENESEEDPEDQDEEQNEDEPEEDQANQDMDIPNTELTGFLTDLEGHAEAQPDQKTRPWNETEIVPRTNWGAEPAKREFPLVLPVQHIWFTYSTDHTTPCRSFRQCAKTVLDLQTKCLTSTHLTDIPFNFLIGGDGRVYMGRGWKVQPPASSLEPTIGGNRLDIAFIGNLNRETLTKKMKQAVRSLVDYGVDNGYISPTYSYKEWDKSGVRSKDTGL